MVSVMVAITMATAIIIMATMGITTITIIITTSITSITTTTMGTIIISTTRGDTRSIKTEIDQPIFMSYKLHHVLEQHHITINSPNIFMFLSQEYCDRIFKLVV